MVQGHTENAANPDLGALSATLKECVSKRSLLWNVRARKEPEDPIHHLRQAFSVARPFLPKTRPAGHRQAGDSSAPGLTSQSVLETCFGNGLGAGTMLPLSRIKG
jgi:hypothetical protein